MATAQRAGALAQSLSAPTFRTVLDALGEDREVALGTLWRLIARGALSVELETLIGLDCRAAIKTRTNGIWRRSARRISIPGSG